MRKYEEIPQYIAIIPTNYFKNAICIACVFITNLLGGQSAKKASVVSVGNINTDPIW